MTQHKRKFCSRCKQGDREFPYTLYGENGQLIRVKNNKIVCYHCWNMLNNGKGEYMGLDKDGNNFYSTDEIAFSEVKITGWFDKKSKTPYGKGKVKIEEQQLDQVEKKQNNAKSDRKTKGVKIRVTINLDQADDSISELFSEQSLQLGVFGCDKEGAYHMYYHSRTDLVKFEDVEVLKND